MTPREASYHPKSSPLPGLVVIGLVEQEVLCFRFDIRTSCDPVIKVSHNLILGFVSPYISTFQRLPTIRLLEEEIFCN